MAKFDEEIIRQVLLNKVPSITQDSLSEIMGEMRSVSDAIQQDDELAKPKKIKKQVVQVDIMNDEEPVATATLKIPVAVANSDHEDTLERCLNTIVADYNASRSTARGRVENMAQALNMLKNKHFKPFQMQLLSRPNDSFLEVNLSLDPENTMSMEEYETLINPPEEEEPQQGSDTQESQNQENIQNNNQIESENN